MNRVKSKDSPYETNAVCGARFSLTAEDNNARTLSIQLLGQSLTDGRVRGSVHAYISDDANGDSLAASAPSGGWAIGTDGLLIPIVANKCAILVSESDGDIDVVITENTAKTFYVILVLPDGSLVASPAIAFE